MGFFFADFDFYVGVSVHKQYSQLDTIFNYMFHFGPPGKYLQKSLKNRPPVGRRRVVGLGDLSIDILLEVQNETYSQILYLIIYIAYGPKFPHTNETSPRNTQSPKKSRFTNKNPEVKVVTKQPNKLALMICQRHERG